jgi:branched-chain amino acid aminotransferase
MQFTHIPHPAPVDASERAARIVEPGFGRVFTDHMVTIRYTEGLGWHDATVQARGPLMLDPATAVLHYAQEIFEGMKAYQHPDGSMALFRPTANAARFNRSAARMAMPAIPEDVFVESCERLVRADAGWMPPGEGGSLYLRPFMFASEVFLGVKPSSEYLFMVIAAASGAYWKGPSRAISIWVSDDYTRAAPGGTGGAKCGGNYAASLIAQAEATEKGCDQVVFLDAVERRYVEELGGMNVFFVFDDGSVATPPIAGTILEGITRASLLRLAQDEGLSVREEPYAIEQWRADASSGQLREAFACGTAAVVTSIGQVRSASGDFTIGAGGPGQITERLRERLTGIQRGTLPDPHNWVHRIG